MTLSPTLAAILTYALYVALLARLVFFMLKANGESKPPREG